MSKSLAVYSDKPIVTWGKLASLALESGLSLRYLYLGGSLPHDLEQLLSNKSSSSEAVLTVGADTEHTEALAEYDRLFARRDQKSIAAMLNGGKLPWCELYNSKFNYVQHLKIFPKDKASLDQLVPESAQPALQAAKRRYIVHNYAGTKENAALMKALAGILQHASQGILVKHKAPKR